jgi:hypothetical protein
MHRKWTISTEEDILKTIRRYRRAASWVVAGLCGLVVVVSFPFRGILAVWYGVVGWALCAAWLLALGETAERRVHQALLRYMLAMCVRW